VFVAFLIGTYVMSEGMMSNAYTTWNYYTVVIFLLVVTISPLTGAVRLAVLAHQLLYYIAAGSSIMVFLALPFLLYLQPDLFAMRAAGGGLYVGLIHLADWLVHQMPAFLMLLYSYLYKDDIHQDQRSLINERTPHSVAAIMTALALSPLFLIVPWILCYRPYLVYSISLSSAVVFALMAAVAVTTNVISLSYFLLRV
jgi:hypothetical protein